MRTLKRNPLVCFRLLAGLAATLACALFAPRTAAAFTTPPAEPLDLAAPLSIQPPAKLAALADFLVGRGTLDRDAAEFCDFSMPLPSSADADARFIRHILLPAGGLFDRLDTVDTQTPWSITTTVHIPAPFDSPLVPFVALAAESDTRVDDFRRAGLGGGAQWILAPNASIGAELLYFGGGPSSDLDPFGREARVMTRFQLTF